MDELANTGPWSATAPEVHDALVTYRDADEPAVVASVVAVDGSAYRRPGARMLLTDESSLGTITAGCLEGTMAELAAEVTAAGEPRVETFDLMDDDSWGLGLGCNGIIDVLLEPLDKSWDPALAELQSRRPVAILTAIESSDPAVAVGDRTTLILDGSRASPRRTALPERTVDALTKQAVEMARTGRTGTEIVETDGGTIHLVVDGIEPPPELLLFGSQNDIHPVASQGRSAGFRVTVASARGARSDLSDFPAAHGVKVVRPPDLPDLVETSERTYVVLMSHNLVDDRLALEALLSETDLPYVGLMGPRDRFEELREASEYRFSSVDLDRIATPVGLDLGGGSPSQIGLSIVAEVLAVHNEREGGRLRDREGPIHERIDE